MGSRPKTPKPTAQELELQRNQRQELDTLTRDRNATMKALKRTLGGRRGLLGSGSELGIGVRPGNQGGGSSSNRGGLGIRGAGGGIMGAAAGGSGGRSGGGGGMRIPARPSGQRSY